jgi:N-acetylglucosaminyldiphosphoundecaprenol N-acetyl-beta-D-mannosaminyltransferase
MPLVWAARLKGTPLPERVAGSSLIEPLAARAAREGRSMYLLGGSPRAAEGTAAKLQAQNPDLKVAGWSSPTFSESPTPDQVAGVLAEVARTKPDLLLVGIGSPKQERLIGQLRSHAPSTWMIGVGISFSFLAGQVARAPEWMRDAGLEWVHRLVQEPRRLARRYLRDDASFALELFARVLAERLTSRAGRAHE